jgi:hypothetical protein
VSNAPQAAVSPLVPPSPLSTSAYDTVLVQWPVAVEFVDVFSAYGATLHRSADRAMEDPWCYCKVAVRQEPCGVNVATLSRTRRVYVVDQIGG